MSSKTVVVSLPPAHAACSLPRVRIAEKSSTSSTFNIFPGKSVSETLEIREYRLWSRYIEASFDRTYHSEMTRSPSHLIVWSMLIQMQKMLYVYLCHEYGLEYDPLGSEKIKMWPADVTMKLPKLIREEEGLTIKMSIDEIRQRGPERIDVRVVATVADIVAVEVGVPAFFVGGVPESDGSFCSDLESGHSEAPGI